MPPCAGAMKAKELASFLKKYALDSPAQDPDASKQESAGKPDAEAEDSEDPQRQSCATGQLHEIAYLFPDFLLLRAHRSSADAAKAGFVAQLQRIVGSSVTSWQRM